MKEEREQEREQEKACVRVPPARLSTEAVCRCADLSQRTCACARGACDAKEGKVCERLWCASCCIGPFSSADLFPFRRARKRREQRAAAALYPTMGVRDLAGWLEAAGLAHHTPALEPLGEEGLCGLLMQVRERRERRERGERTRRGGEPMEGELSCGACALGCLAASPGALAWFWGGSWRSEAKIQKDDTWRPGSAPRGFSRPHPGAECGARRGGERAKKNRHELTNSPTHAPLPPLSPHRTTPPTA